MPPPRKKNQKAAATPKAPRQSKLAKEHNITAQQENEIREAFSLYSAPHPDYPNSKEGAMPTSSLRQALAALGTPPTDRSELRELMETVDPDDSGHFPFEHFVAIAALKLQARLDSDTQEEVQAAFHLFAGDSERIGLGHLRRAAKKLNEQVDDQVLKDMIQEANGGSGIGKGVDLEEFEAVMKRAGVFR